MAIVLNITLNSNALSTLTRRKQKWEYVILLGNLAYAGRYENCQIIIKAKKTDCEVESIMQMIGNYCRFHIVSDWVRVCKLRRWATIDPHDQKEDTEIRKIAKFGVYQASFDWDKLNWRLKQDTAI